MDGVAALASTPSAELLDRLSTVEKENASLQSKVNNLEQIVQDLQQRLSTLNLNGIPAISGQAAAPAPQKSAPAAIREPKEDEDDDGVDLFASDSEVLFYICYY